jgi:hypothetical protein
MMAAEQSTDVDCHLAAPSQNGDLMVPAGVESPVETSASEAAAIRAENERIEMLMLCGSEQAPYEMVHMHQPGVYLRQIKMFAGTELIGAEHLGEHWNLVMTGRALVKMDGHSEEIVAPTWFRSGKSVRKTLLILEDMVWITVHANPMGLRDPKDLFDMIARKSPVQQRFEQLIKDPRFSQHGEQFKPQREDTFE